MSNETTAEGPGGLPWLSPAGDLSPAAREVEHHFHWARRDGLEVGVIWLEIVGVGPAKPWWLMVKKAHPSEDFRWNIEATLFVEVGGSKYEDTGTYEVPLDSDKYSRLIGGKLDLLAEPPLSITRMTHAEEVTFNERILR